MRSQLLLREPVHSRVCTHVCALSPSWAPSSASSHNGNVSREGGGWRRDPIALDRFAYSLDATPWSRLRLLPPRQAHGAGAHQPLLGMMDLRETALLEEGHFYPRGQTTDEHSQRRVPWHRDTGWDVGLMCVWPQHPPGGSGPWHCQLAHAFDPRAITALTSGRTDMRARDGQPRPVPSLTDG